MSEIMLIGSFCVLSLLDFLGPCVLSHLDSLFLLLRCSGIYIVTLLDFLFFCHVSLLFVVFFTVCVGFDLRGSTLLGFLVDFTTSFHESTSSSGSVSKRTCPRTQYLGKLIENRLEMPCSLDMQSLHKSGSS